MSRATEKLWLVPAGRRPVTGDPRLAPGARMLRLATARLLQPDGPGELLVHRGRLRISELRDEGGEIARDVAQAGDVWRCQPDPPPAGPAYPLARCVLMALGESRVVLSPLPDSGEDTP